MSDIDPDIAQALAEAQGKPAAGNVDPDIAAALTEAQAPHTSWLQALASGLGQSAFGAGDELGAGLQAILSQAQGGNPQEMSQRFADTYRRARGENRALDSAAQDRQPLWYWGGLGAGVVGTAPLLGGAQGGSALSRLGQATLSGLAQGGAFGAGASDADLTRGEVLPFLKDVGTYGAAGGIFGGGAGLLGEGLGALARGTAGKRAALRAAQKAKNLEAQLAAEKAAAGTIGGISQKGSRYLENFQRWAEDPTVPQALREKLQAFMGSEEGRALVQGVLQNQLEDAPKVLGQRAAAQQELAAMQAGRDAAVDAATDADLGFGKLARMAKERAIRYGLPAAAGAVFGPAGLAEGAVLRPMAHSAKRFLTSPAAKNMALSGLGAISRAGSWLLGRGVPATERGALNVIPFPVRASASAMPMAADGSDPQAADILAALMNQQGAQ